MQECHGAHTRHTCMTKRTLATAGKESQACMWHSTPSSSTPSSNIPLIGFWIHKMPPIRWGDWPSIPGHRPSLSPYLMLFQPPPKSSGAPLPWQPKEEGGLQPVHMSHHLLPDEQPQPDWLSGAHTHTHTHTHAHTHAGALLRNNPAG